jgi:ABC-type molybdate transport system substrate-binding protein
MKRLVTVVLAAGLALAGCGGANTATPGPQRVPVTVLAAASLTDVFTKLKPSRSSTARPWTCSPQPMRRR